MIHSHGHDSRRSARRLRTALLLTLGIFVVEAVAGYFANSLALVSDAGHILTDVFALGLAWYAMHLLERPPNARNTFGYQRGGILAALLNAGVLLLVAVFVTIEAVSRLQHSQHVVGGLVIVSAAVAVLVNSVIAYTLHGEGEDNLNIQAALFHVLGDIGASLAVIIAGTVVLVWRAYLVDPILSLLIALLIAIGAWQIVRDTVSILMEGTPRDVELEELSEAMQEVPGVLAVHDLHVWALSDGFRLLSAHVEVPDQSLGDTAALVSDLKVMLRRRFHIEHATIEVECVDCRLPQSRPIQLLPREQRRNLP